MVRNAQLNLRIKLELKAKLEKLAKQDRRTLSAYVEKVLDEHVESTSSRKKHLKRDRTLATPN
jgi:predicted DNA-binding protein